MLKRCGIYGKFYGRFTPHSTAFMLLSSKMYILFEGIDASSCYRSLKFQKFLFLITIINYPWLFSHYFGTIKYCQLTSCTVEFRLLSTIATLCL